MEYINREVPELIVDRDNQAKPELYLQELQPQEDRAFQVPVEKVGNVNVVPIRHFHDDHRTKQLLHLYPLFVQEIYP